MLRLKKKAICSILPSIPRSVNILLNTIGYLYLQTEVTSRSKRFFYTLGALPRFVEKPENKKYTGELNLLKS